MHLPALCLLAFWCGDLCAAHGIGLTRLGTAAQCGGLLSETNKLAVESRVTGRFWDFILLESRVEGRRPPAFSFFRVAGRGLPAEGSRRRRKRERQRKAIFYSLFARSVEKIFYLFARSAEKIIFESLTISYQNFVFFSLKLCIFGPRAIFSF